jgi:hypothetical protein
MPREWLNIVNQFRECWPAKVLEVTNVKEVGRNLER